MKRLYVLLTASFVCAVVLAQHPNSQGGSPFYWALIGAIAYGGFYVIYLLLGYLIKILKRKNATVQVNVNLENGSPLLGSNTLEEKKDAEIPPNNQIKVERRYCRYCGKEFDYVSVKYCKHCGKPID